MSPSLSVSIAHGLAAVDPAAWDALAGDHNPFVEHAFLRSLEVSESVGASAGWLPHHLLVWAGDASDRRLVGAAPCYLKDNSYGEYIFDWGWANASHRAGLPYYPKVVVAVPFTPATGPRMLVHPEADPASVYDALAQGALALAAEAKASSVHWLFTPAEQAETLAARKHRHRLSHQYHWTRQGDWSGWDDWLASLRSKRRKEIRRERRKAAALGFDIAVQPASDLSQRDLADLYRCYRSTIDSRHAIPYLSRDWFDGLGERLGHRALVVTARREGRLRAASLAFRKGEHLYGRYWGALEHTEDLHFEVCYYQLIAYALEHGITRLEAGAQGTHKIARGFLPALTHSAHWVRHPGLAEAVYAYIDDEADHVREDVETLSEHTPYKRTDGGG